MLQSMRKGWLYAFFIAFLLLGGASLVLMDYGGYYKGTVSSNDIAVAGKTTLTAQKLDSLVKRATQPQGISGEQAYQLGIVDQIIRMQVLEYLMAQEADRLGLVVSDDQVIAQLRAQLGPMLPKDQNAADMVRNFIRAQGMSEHDFIEQMRDQVANGLLRNTLSEATRAARIDVQRDIARYEGETRTVDIAVLEFVKAKGITAPTEDDLKKAYEAQKQSFMLPEKRSFKVATLPLSRIHKDKDVTEEQIAKAYTDQKESFAVDETRVLEQAILKDTDLATKLIEKLKGGAKMQAALSALKQPDSAYVGTQGFTRAGMPEALAEITFTAKKNDILGPIQTALGQHVMIVKDVQAPRTKELKEVKDQIKAQLEQDSASDKVQSILNDLDDQAARGEAIDTIAKSHDMTVSTHTSLTRDDTLSAYKDDSKDILGEVFAGNVGEISPAGELADGTIYLVAVTAIDTAHPKPFPDVKKEITENWMRQEQTKATLLTAQKILDAVNTGKQKFIDAAKTEGTTITTLKNVGRSGEAPKPLDAGARERLFNLPAGQAAFVPMMDSVVVLMPTSVVLPEKAEVKKADEARSGEAENTVVLYLNALRDRLGVDVNDALVRQLYAPKDRTAE